VVAAAAAVSGTAPVASLDIHVQPRASRTEVVGRHGDAIKIRIAAPPTDGSANDELVRFLAKTLDVKRSAVTIVSGMTSRRKRVAVEGVALEQAVRRLGG
jgi:uncharacterized protein (TIGR00251 family)